MPDRRKILAAILVAAAAPAAAQFTGPSVQGTPSTVAEVQNARVGSYVTLEGNVVAHLREDYYRFADATGEIRVEIPARTFAGQQVEPATRVRIMGEIDRGFGGRYIWVKSLTLP
ncbi:MAG TPA: NirD/YgiW/YdeI family stress tolerance protein [Amaricoccus sp.]|uniref:YgiW/YdeI family stress tolerance OB fold protein n=1 Tax=Amaricoccus sp. TaxID=1872485 RepID=UPI002B943AD7|nr:NirD/YgiW/YdeI family stress tolerance protein [Amaricoccus sp.]HMQ93901.1 NirD/YgiW/YdeI family stress tolerance protein [Amaricoccus sp.]HMR51055.1 NirD/YgiW/YdeI family stress tolerance protein [Amaricoccus sp.]HMR62145.1 NirD/YgiW/YdeI family stress tolerance protein [Amaricoccus sp.]HMU00332.1 NirD/YgiW/YdeI family stress tolerance protein [Amaricoccus sp.]